MDSDPHKAPEIGTVGCGVESAGSGICIGEGTSGTFHLAHVARPYMMGAEGSHIMNFSFGNHLPASKCFCCAFPDFHSDLSAPTKKEMNVTHLFKTCSPQLPFILVERKRRWDWYDSGGRAVM